jgi:hypothetical protein
MSMPLLLERPIQKADWLREAGEMNGASNAPTRLRGAEGEQAPGSDAGPWESAVKKIVEFQHLGDDWDGQGARKPSSDLLASAIGLAYLLNQRGVEPPNCVVPGVDGTVILEWHFSDGTYSDVEIVRPFYAEVMLIEPGKPAQHWTLPTE